MKKYQKITILLVAILALVASIVYAASENSATLEKEAEELTTTAINAQVETILAPIADNNSVKNVEKYTNELTNKEMYRVSTEDYMVSLDSSSKELVGIYEKEPKYNLNTTTDKAIAQKYITSKYSELKLPSEYKLVYLEKFDDYVWEADFQKEYNGVYNMYESVKVFFNPENQEIVALTLFDEPYTANEEAKLDSETATETATSSLNIEKENIKDSELTLIKANNYYGDNNDKSIHKAWVLTTNEEDKIFVDAATGKIIGGDSFND